jgi:hypothetical protein
MCVFLGESPVMCVFFGESPVMCERGGIFELKKNLNINNIKKN